MKTLLTIILISISVGLLAQSGSIPFTVAKSRVTDSTTVVEPTGWGSLFYNAQASPPKWEVTENGTRQRLLKVVSNGLTATTQTIKLGGAFTATTKIGSNGSGNFAYDNSGTIWTNGSVGLWYGTPGTYTADYAYMSTGNKTVDIGVRNNSTAKNAGITFDGASAQPNIKVSGTSGFAGLQEASDFSGNYVAASLTRKGYVDSHLFGYTATNSPSSNYAPLYNGTNITWANVITGAAGSNTQIQFNDGGAFAGDPLLVWDKTNKFVQINGLAISSGSTSVSTAGNIFIGNANYNTGSAQSIGIGGLALSSASGDQNIAIGRQAGQNITTGTRNVAIGAFSANGLTTGSYNVALGYFTQVPSISSDGQLSIQNAIYGASNLGTGSTTSTGSIGIYQQSPSYNLHVTGNANNATLFLVEENSGTNLIEAIESTGVNKLGFFAATPVAKPAAVTDPQGIADALTSLGLLASSTISAGGAGTVTSVGITNGTNITHSGGPITSSGNITVNAIPTGSNTQIQFNNSGVFGADSKLVWTGTALNVNDGTISNLNISTTASSPSFIQGGSGSVSLPGGTVNIYGGDPYATNGSGGDVVLQAGGKTGTGTAGNVKMPTLPTSGSGLPSGSLWNDNGFVSVGTITGNDRNLFFNSSGKIAASDNVKYLTASNGERLSITCATCSGTATNSFIEIGGANGGSNLGISTSTTSGGAGQSLLISTATATTSGQNGGDIGINAGAGNGAGTSGNITIDTNPANVANSGVLTLKSILKLYPISTSFSSNQNDYDIGNGAVIHLSTDNTVTRSITGLSKGVDGRLLIIRNENSTAIINFNNEDASSSASNRIHTSTGGILNLNPAKVLMLMYDSTLSRWVDISF